MSDQTPSSGQGNPSTNNPASVPATSQQDWRALRRAERNARRQERRAQGGSSNGAWIGGIVLIVLGVLFLLQNVRGVYFNNWWALFILIPALGALAAAWNLYRQTGQFNRRVRGALLSGGILLLITATFLFNWSWGLVVPVMIIIWGVALLLNSLLVD